MRRIPFVDADDPHRKQEDRFYPLWPAYLAAYVEKHLGPGKVEFRLMSGNYEDQLDFFKPHMVAISSVSMNYSYAKEYARTAKHYNLPVVVGGIHISLLPQSLTKDMDVGCVGEGEETFLDLIRYYLAHDNFHPEDLNYIKGILYHDNGSIIRTPPRLLQNSLDHFRTQKERWQGTNVPTLCILPEDALTGVFSIQSAGIGIKYVLLHLTMYWRK